jgi:predicted HicB family RNase H-like nuclease
MNNQEKTTTLVIPHFNDTERLEVFLPKLAKILPEYFEIIVSDDGSSPDELRREFQKSLEVFLEVCKEQGIEPRRSFSGRFNLRISPELHEKLAMTAEVQGKSLNTLAQEALQRSVTS